MKYNKQAIELNDLLKKWHAKGGYEIINKLWLMEQFGVILKKNHNFNPSLVSTG